MQQRHPGHEWRGYAARRTRRRRRRSRASGLARNARAGPLCASERRGPRRRYGRGNALAHFRAFLHHQRDRPGTGLGLSLVYAIVTDSAGAIDVKSAPKQGTAFAIYLTRAEIALAAADEAAAPPPRGNGERVLLIDDEAPLLAVTAEVLSRLGYEPVSFSDSRAALAAFEAAPERFDVVITDEVMPGLTGTGLADVVRRRRPDLPIVLLSGYSGPILTQDALAAGVSELLTKPLQSREIAATLARVLRRAA